MKKTTVEWEIQTHEDQKRHKRLLEKQVEIYLAVVVHHTVLLEN